MTAATQTVTLDGAVVVTRRYDRPPTTEDLICEVFAAIERAFDEADS